MTKSSWRDRGQSKNKERKGGRGHATSPENMPPVTHFFQLPPKVSQTPPNSARSWAQPTDTWAYGGQSYSNSSRVQYFTPAVTEFYNLSSPNPINSFQAGSFCVICVLSLCYYLSLNTLPTRRQIPIFKCQLDLTSHIETASLTFQPTQNASFSNLW